jgi:CubicO group peptidase (beta-lactamase class C family)
MKKINFLGFFLFLAVAAMAQAKVSDKAEQKLQAKAVLDEEWTPAKAFNAQYDSLVTAYARNGKFNGVVLVAKNGEIYYKKAFGYRDAEQKIQHDVNDIFQIGSVTKQFTAAIIMQLENEGKLSLNDHLEKYFPGFPNGNKITIEHLLTHTSGLHNYTDDTVLTGKADVTKNYSRDEMLKILKKYPADFEPGTKWSYSNSGYSMLGYIIEKVTRKPYEKVVRERILQPLGMTNSGFDFTHLKNKQRSKGYFSVGDVINPAPVVDSTIAYSAGALYSTVDDLLKWERAIFTDKILPQSAWKKVFTPYKNNYGYGWGIGNSYDREYMAHSGGIHGFSSYILRYPQDQLVVIMLDNAMGSSLTTMARQLAAITFGKPVVLPKPKTEIRVDKRILETYAGVYELTPDFAITIRLDGDVLKAQATGQDEFTLFAESETMFFLKVVEAKIEFVKDGSGQVTSIILHQGGVDQTGKRKGVKESTPTRKEMQIEKSVLQNYQGEYELVPGFSISIRLDGDVLKAKATGQEEYPIYPESETVFFYKVVEAKIEFVKDNSGKVTSIILHQGGRDLPGEKVK